MGKHRQFHDLGFSVGRLLATISEYVHSRLGSHYLNSRIVQWRILASL